MSKVINLDNESITFDTGELLYSSHEQDCCENHWLSFDGITLEDFKDLEFDLSNDNFFERIEGYGIALKPVYGHPIRVPGYGANNGYYSSELTLVLEKKGEPDRRFDISDCQVIDS